MKYAVVTIISIDHSVFSELVKFKDDQEIADYARRIDKSRHVKLWIMTPASIEDAISPKEASEKIERKTGIVIELHGVKEWRPEDKSVDL